MTSSPMRRGKVKHYIEYKGERLPLAELCKRYGAPYSRVYHRVVESGIPIEKALTAPPDKHKRHTQNTGASIEVLGHRYVLEILLELRNKPGQSKNKLAARIGHKSTILGRLDELEREGWIECRKGGMCGAHLVMLTSKGRIVADGLMAIERKL